MKPEQLRHGQETRWCQLGQGTGGNRERTNRYCWANPPLFTECFTCHSGLFQSDKILQADVTTTHTPTMLAARADQENAVHAQQAAAAAKPLNQGLKGYTAKTPGNRAPKTPFKVPLNDENASYQAGKSVLKTNGKNQGGLTLAKQGGKAEKSAFVTPAGTMLFEMR